jgi:leucyl-tRNA synthetase
LGHSISLAREPWPKIDLKLIRSVSQVEVVITVNGKKKAVIEVDPAIKDIPLDACVREALEAAGFSTNNDTKLLIVRDKKSGRPKLVNVVST